MIAASIVTYHTPREELLKCLHSLLGSPLVSRVDIVDNASEERIDGIAMQQGDKVAYIPNRNTGYGAAHNISIQRSLNDDSIKYHLVINSDVYFDSLVLSELSEWMDSHSEVGQIIPRTLFPDGSRQAVCHPLPTPFDLLIRRFTPVKMFRHRKECYDLIPFRMDVPLNVPYHHGCFMMLRTDALRDVGLFDERYFMYPEDIDLTRRMHEHYATIYYPFCSIVHAHRAESRSNMKMMWVHAVNMLRYFRKWGFIADEGRRRFNRRLFDSLETL